MLQEVHLQDNSGLVRPDQLDPLQAAEALQTLRLAPGPIACIPHWRLHVVYKLPQLLHLDGSAVTAEEQVGHNSSPSR